MAKGKSTKVTKKAAAKTADFTRAKLKLGKGKKAAANSTAISFKSKSVAMPHQSVSKTAPSGPVTKRNLGLDDIVIQSRHYSAGVRKDSLLALRELCASYPEIIKPKLSIIVGAISRLLADSDHNVRKALLSFSEWFLPLVSQSDLYPFIGPLVLHTTSALSSIYTEIKVDAVKFLQTLIRYTPSIIHQRENRLLQCLLTLIGIDSSDINKDQSNATSTLGFPLSSKIVVFQALADVLDLKYAEPSSSINPCTSRALRCEWQTATFHQLWHSYPLLAKDQAVYTSDDISVMESQLHTLGRTNGKTAAAELKVSESPVDLWKSLQSTLVALFLESAPAIFSPEISGGSLSSQHLCLTSCIIRICHTLCMALQRDDAMNDIVTKQFRSLLKHLSIYFPYESNRHGLFGRTNVAEDRNLKQMSLNFASMLIVVDQADAKSNRATSSTKPARQVKDIQEVMSWFCGLLRGDPTPSHPLGCQLDSETYEMLLPCLRVLINNSTQADRSVLEACIKHSESGGPCKKLSFSLIASIIDSQADLFADSTLRIWPAEEVSGQLQHWISNLTKTLWEAGVKQPKTCLDILEFLSKLARKGSISFASQETLNSLHSLFIPFFRIDHPVRGAISGPYTKLDLNTRMAALHLAYYLDLCVESNSLRDIVALVLSGESKLVSDMSYWSQIIQMNS